MNAARGTASLVLALALAGAQRPSRDRPAREPDFSAYNVPYDGSFTFVRLRFTPSRVGWGGGGGYFDGRNYSWDHDYPRAEQHLSIILRELTYVRPHDRGTNIFGAEDADLFKYPVAYVSEPGFWTLTEAEAGLLRAYLAKGGFFILDDFRGGQWLNFERVLGQILPGARPVRLDPSHPIFNAFFVIESLDDMRPYEDVPAEYYGVFEDNDPSRRLLMIVNYNNDIGESWEWSSQGFISIDISNKAYRLGVNYVIYAMTH